MRVCMCAYGVCVCVCVWREALKPSRQPPGGGAGAEEWQQCLGGHAPGRAREPPAAAAAAVANAKHSGDKEGCQHSNTGRRRERARNSKGRDTPECRECRAGEHNSVGGWDTRGGAPGPARNSSGEWERYGGRQGPRATVPGRGTQQCGSTPTVHEAVTQAVTQASALRPVDRALRRRGGQCRVAACV